MLECVTADRGSWRRTRNADALSRRPVLHPPMIAIGFAITA